MHPQLVIEPHQLKQALIDITHYFRSHGHVLTSYDYIIEDLKQYYRITVAPMLASYNLDLVQELGYPRIETREKTVRWIDPLTLTCVGAKECYMREEVYGIPAFEPNSVRARYLSSSSEILNKVSEWMQSFHCLAIKSPMGTGKTRLLEYILGQYEPSRVLWVTHRQSLTNNLFGAFEKHGFVSYLNVDGSLYEHDRVIVQLDSLYRIMRMSYESVSCRVYDLVIIDEIEGLLSHFGSKHLNARGRTASEYYWDLVAIVKASQKLIVLDADIGDRTRVFVSQFDHRLVVNRVLKLSRLFRVTNDSASFNQSIMDGVKAGLNLLIVSMTALSVDRLSEELTELGINHIKYTSATDDHQKKDLSRVNEIWTQYQVVLYSPTIESGVDFSQEHFDRVYGIIASGKYTCSIRGFLQMLGRSRLVKSQVIECLYTRMPASEGQPVINARLYTPRDVLKSYQTQGFYNGKTVLSYAKSHEIVDGELVIEKRNQLSSFDQIMMLNKAEEWNKYNGVAATVLKKAVERAGDRIEFVYVTNVKPNSQKLKYDRIQEIVDLDLSKYDAIELMRKQVKSELSAQEKLALYKHEFCELVRIKSDCPQFKEMLEYYESHKESIRNAELLFGYMRLKETIDHKEADYLTSDDRTRLNIIKEILTCLLGDRLDPFLKQTHVKGERILDYKEAVTRLLQAEYFKNEAPYRKLFFKSSNDSNPSGEDLQNKVTNTLHHLLDKFGLLLTRKQIKYKGTRTCVYTLKSEPKLFGFVKIIHPDDPMLEALGLP